MHGRRDGVVPTFLHRLCHVSEAWRQLSQAQNPPLTLPLTFPDIAFLTILPDNLITPLLCYNYAVWKIRNGNLVRERADRNTRSMTIAITQLSTSFIKQLK